MQTIQALLIVAQAFLIADIIVRVFTQNQDLTDVMPRVVQLAVVIGARAVTAFL